MELGQKVLLVRKRELKLSRKEFVKQLNDAGMKIGISRLCRLEMRDSKRHKTELKHSEIPILSKVTGKSPSYWMDG